MTTTEIRHDELTKAVLICADIGEYDAERSLDELEELAVTAKADTAAKVIQKRESYDNATCIGAGRLKEVAAFCRENDVSLLIFDNELTATQIRNIENLTEIRTIDRTTLILDIFAQRARSKEGRLQVELAQQKYRLPRLAGLGTSLSRLGGGIGTRGPGETRLETDRRHIRRRIRSLEAELAAVEKQRNLRRKRRKKDNILSVAIVGYTNAGKSTLLNALTNAGVLAEDKLFATLDPTARALNLPDGRKVLLIDTVGLIRRLPHHLIEAFHSTLEEAVSADLILHVCDAASEDAASQAEVTEKLLAELGCGDIPVLQVLNKCDLVPQIQSLFPNEDSVFISAKTGFGLDTLLQKITQKLPSPARHLFLLLPYQEGSLLSQIRKSGQVRAEEYTDRGILAECMVPPELFTLVKDYIQSDHTES